jgi:hypothetical protein
MLKALVDRYGTWTEHALLGPIEGSARVQWPGRGEYESRIGLFVGRDAARWLWCAPPPGTLQLPADFHVEGIQVSGRSDDGRDFTTDACAPSALSFLVGAESSGSKVLLRVESPDLTLRPRPQGTGQVEASWVLTNAIFNGIDWSADPVGGTGHQRADRFSFAVGPRQWQLKLLPAFRDKDREDLRHGIVRSLPTATLSTALGNSSELQDANDEAYAVTRLLSFASGSSVGGGVRCLSLGGNLSEESFLEWPTFGTAEHFENHALIDNHPQLAGALRSFLAATVTAYRTHDAVLGLSRAIGYLEQAHSSNVIDVRLALSVFGLEALTHRLCLQNGLTEDQLAGMNIQSKLNRARNHMGMNFIDRRFAEDTREDVRNPMMHTGEIPDLSIQEKVRWSTELYTLAFKMLMFLLGYAGNWFDPTRSWQPRVGLV